MLATFSVCLFVLLMQFLWKYVSDMIGKGVDVIVLAKLFFYAGLTFTSMALPLSVLLASLMVFGNLGEHFELLAMKASGISLLRIMKPLVFTCIIITCISFYFQDSIIPKAQVKMSTIMLSLRQKSPELDIPEGEFYKDIPGYNVYVRHKDKKNNMLRDVMIYDYSDGFENAAVIVSDSAKLSMSEDKKNLVLTLFSGKLFKNLKNEGKAYSQENSRYQRETFSLRTKIISSFDGNFNMIDESIMGNRDIGKNYSKLTNFVDSVQHDADSINRQNIPYFKNRIYVNSFKQPYRPTQNSLKNDTLFDKGFQAYVDNLPVNKQIDFVNKVKNKVDNINNEYSFISTTQSNMARAIRSHKIQLNMRFTMSLACLIFFFVGAPLGSIIRKGGLGMPAVLSIFLFVFYYSIDTLGLKMAKQAIWPVWEGMWLSTALLTSLGIFLTYKAVNDSVMMNPDVWRTFIQKLLGKREIRNYTKKEVIMIPPDYSQDMEKMLELNILSKEYLLKHASIPFYTTFWKRSEDKELERIIQLMNFYIEDLRNSDNTLVISKLMEYPVVLPLLPGFMKKPSIRWICSILLPIGLILYIASLFGQKRINNDLKIINKINEELRIVITDYKNS